MVLLLHKNIWSSACGKKEISNPGAHCQETLRFKNTSAVGLPLFSILWKNRFKTAFAVVSKNYVFQKSVLFAHIVGSCNISSSKNILIFHNFPLAIDSRGTGRLHLISALCVHPASTYENICLWWYSRMITRIGLISSTCVTEYNGSFVNIDKTSQADWCNG